MNDESMLEGREDTICSELKKCIELYDSGIFNLFNSNCQLFREAAFIELLVKLNHILQHRHRENKRITFSEYIENKNVADITDLINQLRNAACHINSEARKVQDPGVEFVFNAIVGLSSINLGGVILSCEFRDDVAFFYGDLRIYLKHHIGYLLRDLFSIYKDNSRFRGHPWGIQ